MKVYKLTDQNMQTHKGFQWTLGVKVATSGKGELCGSGWLHFYTDPLLAILLNPIHAAIKKPRLFEAKAGGKKKEDHGLKIGFTDAVLTRELPVPEITLTQRVAFGILCALKVYTQDSFVSWAKKWLSGKDRTKAAAVKWANKQTRTTLAGAGLAAAWAAGAAEVAEAGMAGMAARTAADAAAWAARTVTAAGTNNTRLDLPALAKKAMEY